MNVSPLTIRIMLACLYSPNPKQEIGPNVWNSEAGCVSQKWLYDNELISIDDKATRRGEAWVNHICATPLPVQAWVSPDELAKLKQREIDQPF